MANSMVMSSKIISYLFIHPYCVFAAVSRVLHFVKGFHGGAKCNEYNYRIAKKINGSDFQKNSKTFKNKIFSWSVVFEIIIIFKCVDEADFLKF